MRSGFVPGLRFVLEPDDRGGLLSRPELDFEGAFLYFDIVVDIVISE